MSGHEENDVETTSQVASPKVYCPVAPSDTWRVWLGCARDIGRTSDEVLIRLGIKRARESPWQAAAVI